MKAQIHSLTGMSPPELFFGWPMWIPELVPDPEESPNRAEWIVDQIALGEVAKRRLAENREETLRRANRCRTDASYRPGEYVLVNRRRFLLWSIPKLGPQWFEPNRLVQAKHAAVIVRAAPKLVGEVEVAFEYLKHSHARADEEFIADKDDVEVARRDEAMQLDEPAEASEELNSEEGFYEVETILKHKYRQGWRFLTVWKGTRKDAAWEPVRAFVHADGGIAEAFKQYCRDRDSEGPRRQAMSLVSQLRTAQAVSLVTQFSDVRE